LSTETLRKLKRDGTVQAWRQETLRAIKLKIRANRASLRKAVLRKVLKKALEARFLRTVRSKALKNQDREKKQ
jgi:hypothetical protein